MSEWLHNACKILVVHESLARDLDVCANEAVANIILYAYEDHERHHINMRLELKKNQELSLTIQDDGIPFDPFKAVLPESYDKIENIKIGGLGIQLIRNLANECKYCRLNGKNIISLGFHPCQTSASSINSAKSSLLNCCNY